MPDPVTARLPPRPAQVLSAFALLLCALLLSTHWWTGLAFTVPWWRWRPTAVLLLPALPVIGLLLHLATHRGAPEPLRWTRPMARWAGGWVLTTSVGLVLRLGWLYATPITALDPANLLAVVSADDTMVRGVATFWVALLVATMGTKLMGQIDAAALLALVVVTLLVGLPTSTGGSSHHDAPGRAPLVLAGIAVTAGVLWLATMMTLPALVGIERSRDLRSSLARATALTGLLGLILAGATAGLAARWPAAVGAAVSTASTPVTVAQSSIMVVVALVGLRHRRRVLAGTGRPGRGALLLIALGQVTVLVAMLLLVGVPTQS